MDWNSKLLKRTLEPEVMDTVEEAVDYDSMDHSQVNRLFVDDLVEFIRVHGSDIDHDLTVLDLGTGTAQIPVELSSRRLNVRSVIASDLSKEMLKLASFRISESNNVHQLLPTYCDAKCLPIAGESCDIVMSNSIVHHIPNPLIVFQEMRRVVRPGGIVFIRDLMRPIDGKDVEQIVEAYAGNENAHQQKMFRESLHAALTVDEVRELLTQSEFSASWVEATSDRHWTVAGQI